MLQTYKSISPQFTYIFLLCHFQSEFFLPSQICCQLCVPSPQFPDNRKVCRRGKALQHNGAKYFMKYHYSLHCKCLQGFTGTLQGFSAISAGKSLQFLQSVNIVGKTLVSLQTLAHLILYLPPVYTPQSETRN